MAKNSGDTRVSHWESRGTYTGDLYSVNGIRMEYNQLPESQKSLIKAKKKEIYDQLRNRLLSTTTIQTIDNGEKIEVGYSSTGLKHILNDAMISLSGKYFSEESMLQIDKIFEKSNYMPSSHVSKHPRTDGRDLWFTYKENGRGIYFQTTYNKHLKKYELYSIVDKLRSI